MYYDERELSAPYIKRSEKKPRGRIAALFLAVAIICGACFAYRSFRRGGFFAVIFGGEKNTQSTSGTTAASTSENTQETHGKIKTADLSALSQGQKYENKSGYDIDTEYSASLAKIENGSVLLLATRGYEGYAESASGVSFDEKNTAELAKFISSELKKHGVSADFLNVCENGIYTYENAYEKISEYLLTHENVRYIIDISREVICDEKGEFLRPCAYIGGREYAQLKIAVGTDAGGGNHPGWRTRLIQANALFDAINEREKGILMPMLISRARLNQHLPKCTFTLKIGAIGNFYDEAKNTAALFAEIFADTVK